MHGQYAKNSQTAPNGGSACVIQALISGLSQGQYGRQEDGLHVYSLSGLGLDIRYCRPPLVRGSRSEAAPGSTLACFRIPPVTDMHERYRRPMSDQLAGSNLLSFCRQVRARSREHGAAMGVACAQGWQSIAVGILRQELDSMVRVIYLLSQRDRQLREHLLEQAVSGEAWTVPTPNGRLKKVRDREMVDLAQGLQGWTQLVYRFGCSFIHLSNLHDYQARDPFKSLPLEERLEISRYLCQFHGGNVSANSAFDEVVAYAPKVLDKVTRNLELYVDDLEHARDLT